MWILHILTNCFFYEWRFFLKYLKPRLDVSENGFLIEFYHISIIISLSSTQLNQMNSGMNCFLSRPVNMTFIPVA